MTTPEGYQAELNKALIAKNIQEALSAIKDGNEAKAIARISQVMDVVGGTIDENLITTSITPAPDADLVRRLIELLGKSPESNLSPEVQFQRFRDNIIISRRVIADQSSANPLGLESEAQKRFFLDQIDKLFEELSQFSEENSDFLFENQQAQHFVSTFESNLNTLRTRITGKAIDSSAAPEVEATPDHMSFIVLKQAVEFLNSAVGSDPNFDPRHLITDAGFTFNDSSEQSMSAIDLLRSRLQEASVFFGLYSPDRANNLEDLEKGQEFNRKYINPAKTLITRMESRIEVLINVEFSIWDAANFGNSSINPNNYYLLNEASQPLPSPPFSTTNSPKARLDAIVNSATGLDRVGAANTERAAILLASGKLREKQEGRLEEVKVLIDKYLVELQRLTKDESDEIELNDWLTAVQPLANVINQINALPDPLTAASVVHAKTLRQSLEQAHRTISTAGYFNMGVTSDLLKNKIIELVGSNSEGGRYGNALKRINDLLKPVEDREKDPKNMTWEQLAEAIISANFDVYNHAGFQSVDGTELYKYNKSLYDEFQARKPKKQGETVAQEMERCHWICYISLKQLDDILQVEAEIPTCSRDDLYAELKNRSISRETTFKGLCYHQEYGDEFRRITDELIVKTTQSGSPIHYDILTGRPGGRTILWDFIQNTYRPQLRASLYQALPQAERDKKVERVLELIRHTYHLFDFLTIALAELQSTTKTQSHQASKGGRPIKRDSDVLTHWPDKALVHALQRYDSPSHQAAWWLLYMKFIPDYYGKNDPSDPPSPSPTTPKKFHEELEEIRHRLLVHQSAFFDVSSFTGANGIKPSTMFEPIFPDTRSYLRLGTSSAGNPNEPEMLEFDGHIWGPDSSGNYVNLGPRSPSGVRNYNYRGKNIELKPNHVETDLYELVSLAGWKKILELTFGDLPPRLNREQVVASASKGEGGSSTGLLDEFINSGCGRAKMFPGEHMFAVNQLMTHYIFRIFSRIDSEAEKKLTFLEVVKKIQGAAAEKAGLGGYRGVAAQILRNISDDTKGWDDSKVLSTSPKKFRMGKNLLSGVNLRRGQRKAWIDYYRKHEHLSRTTADIPFIGGGLTTVVGWFDDISAYSGERIKAMLDGYEPLPHAGVNRQKSLFVEEKSGESH